MDNYCIDVDEEFQELPSLKKAKNQRRQNAKKAEEEEELDKKLLDMGLENDDLNNMTITEKKEIVAARNQSLKETPPKTENKTSSQEKRDIKARNEKLKPKRYKDFSEDSDDSEILDKKENMTVDDVLENLGASAMDHSKRPTRASAKQAFQNETLAKKPPTRKLGARVKPVETKVQRQKYQMLMSQCNTSVSREALDTNKKARLSRAIPAFEAARRNASLLVPDIVNMSDINASSTPKAKSKRVVNNKKAPAPGSRGSSQEQPIVMEDSDSTLVFNNLSPDRNLDKTAACSSQTMVDNKLDTQQLYEGDTQIISENRPHVTMADFEKPYRLDDMPLIDRRQSIPKPVQYFRMFAPEGVSYKLYATKIKAYFDSYARHLRVAQSRLRPYMKWPPPVIPGRHWSKTIDQKVRGETSIYLEDLSGTGSDTDDDFVSDKTRKLSLRKTQSMPAKGTSATKTKNDEKWEEMISQTKTNQTQNLDVVESQRDDQNVGIDDYDSTQDPTCVPDTPPDDVTNEETLKQEDEEIPPNTNVGRSPSSQVVGDWESQGQYNTIHWVNTTADLPTIQVDEVTDDNGVMEETNNLNKKDNFSGSDVIYQTHSGGSDSSFIWGAFEGKTNIPGPHIPHRVRMKRQKKEDEHCTTIIHSETDDQLKVSKNPPRRRSKRGTKGKNLNDESHVIPMEEVVPRIKRENRGFDFLGKARAALERRKKAVESTDSSDAAPQVRVRSLKSRRLSKPVVVESSEEMDEQSSGGEYMLKEISKLDTVEENTKLKSVDSGKGIVKEDENVKLKSVDLIEEIDEVDKNMKSKLVDSDEIEDNNEDIEDINFVDAENINISKSSDLQTTLNLSKIKVVHHKADSSIEMAEGQVSHPPDNTNKVSKSCDQKKVTKMVKNLCKKYTNISENSSTDDVSTDERAKCDTVRLLGRRGLQNRTEVNKSNETEVNKSNEMIETEANVSKEKEINRSDEMIEAEANVSKEKEVNRSNDMIETEETEIQEVHKSKDVNDVLREHKEKISRACSDDEVVLVTRIGVRGLEQSLNLQRDSIIPESDNELVLCPICLTKFPSRIINDHAAECTNEPTTKPDTHSRVKQASKRKFDEDIIEESETEANHKTRQKRSRPEESGPDSDPEDPFPPKLRLETSPPAARNVPPPTTSACMICNNKVYAEQISEHVNECLDLCAMDGSHSELALYKPQKSTSKEHQSQKEQTGIRRKESDEVEKEEIVIKRKRLPRR